MDWKRVEAFARHRGRLHLHNLPCDVLMIIAVEHLSPTDNLNLVAAFAGRPLNWYDKLYLQHVPECLRPVWIVNLCWLRMQDLIGLLSDEAFWLANVHTTLHAHVDWSPFCDRPFEPIAEYKWQSEKPHAKVKTFPDRIYRAINRVLGRQSGSLHVSLYANNPQGYIHTRSMFSTHFDVLPQCAFYKVGFVH